MKPKIPPKFHPADYESKWQDWWEKKGVYKTPSVETHYCASHANKQNAVGIANPNQNVVSDRETRRGASLHCPKQYVLDMFPYPSSQGLHVGHPEGYSATDIYSRYLRMKGYAVLHPMGWDAFGLPAENFAIKQGIHPAKTTADSIATFRRQINALGFSYDWTKELNTSLLVYYRWTQWLFTFLYQNGLAYKKQAPANWCTHCQTVLANEQVVAGKCERCYHAVIQKSREQWFLRITDFAEQLLSDLAHLDWPESTKRGQINWIGKSSGMMIFFKILQDNQKKQTHNTKKSVNSSEKIEVFTTRPDTLFGATYIVLAPEHQQVLSITKSVLKPQVAKYQKQAMGKTELQRASLDKVKTGVFTGSYAINPITHRRVPIYVSDYCVMGYGTGAIMGVPAHDKRDYDFAVKFGLAITPVCLPSETYNKITQAFSGIKESGKLKNKREKITANRIGRLTHEKQEDGFPHQISLDQLQSFGAVFPQEAYGVLINSGKYSGQTSEECIHYISIDINKQQCGTKTVKYKLRDWLISRQRYWGAPIPVIYCGKCGEQLVPEKDLPVLLPDDVDFRPTGKSPLKRSIKFHDVKCPKCGGKARRESDTMDTFVCSSWYYIAFAFWDKYIKQANLSFKSSSNSSSNIPLTHGLDSHAPFSVIPAPSSVIPQATVVETRYCASKADRQRAVGTVNPSPNANPDHETRNSASLQENIFIKYRDEISTWLPVDLYVGGAEHTVLHLLYSRFIVKALHRAGLIGFNEPFLKLRHIGMILGLDGQKMSKSRGNVINPDEIVGKFGADTLRLYEMFMGPLADKKPWDAHGVEGCYRFLGRIWHLMTEIDRSILNCENAKIWQLTQGLVVAVEHDIKELKFNTAIAKMMSWLNAASRKIPNSKSQIPNKSKIQNNQISQNTLSTLNSLKVFLKILAPFAPHIAEELNFKLSAVDIKDYKSIHLESWPCVDKTTAMANGSNEVFLVEINGKVVEKIASDFFNHEFVETRHGASNTDTKKTVGVFDNGKINKQSKAMEQSNNEAIVNFCLSLPKIKAKLSGHSLKKTIYIPHKLINFVV